ncbi:F-box protein CPR1-like [Silene latifolia]|uniref:F-box protein CPR1-like n=1 Tax=Silene latifolia TaxID=37657 RepID=UPI003D76A96B
MEVIVYSLRVNSWRQLEDKTWDGFTINSNATVSGALIGTHLPHWVFSKPKYNLNQHTLKEWRHRIGCFNLTTEEWDQNVALPPDYGLDEVCFLGDVELRVVDGCLCLLVSIKSDPEKTVDIWVMKEYGVKESWVKFLEISTNKDICTLDIFPLCYRRHDDEILVARGRKQIYARHEVEIKWHSIKDRKSRLSEIHEVSEVPHFYEAFICFLGL